MVDKLCVRSICGNAWAYPHAVSADKEGIDIKIPFGFQGGSMVITPFLEVKASLQLQSNDEAILFADFESTTYPTGWTVGAAPAFPGPVALSEITQIQLRTDLEEPVLLIHTMEMQQNCRLYRQHLQSPNRIYV
jgi:hypothetical protein